MYHIPCTRVPIGSKDNKNIINLKNNTLSGVRNTWWEQCATQCLFLNSNCDWIEPHRLGGPGVVYNTVFYDWLIMSYVCYTSISGTKQCLCCIPGIHWCNIVVSVCIPPQCINLRFTTSTCRVLVVPSLRWYPANEELHNYNIDSSLILLSLSLSLSLSVNTD